ncbi:MAG: major facilitator superfamily 1 [Eubacterium sp.]|nr:major facilitator superfamily 1 [Eubacterium sp.]
MIQTGHNQTEIGEESAKREKLNITLYLASKTISMLGTNIYNFALSLFILKMTGSGASFAINVLIGMLPRIVLGPFAGIIADRVDRKKLTIAFDILSGLVVAVLLGYTQISGLKVLLVYLTSFILSTINIFYDTSLMSSLPNLVKDQGLVRINSYTATAGAVAGVISPVIAGVVFGMVTIKLFLILNAFSFFISAVLELFIKFDLNIKHINPELKAEKSLRNIRHEMSEVISYVRQQKVISSFLKYVLIINLFLNACISVVYPYIINNVLKMKATYFGLFEGCYFVGMIACSIYIGNRKDKQKSTKVLASELALIGLILVLVGLPSLGITALNFKPLLVSYNVILLFILGVTLVAINTPILVLMQRMTPENLRGRITGMLGTLTGGIAPLGILLTGLTIDSIHPFILMSVSGLAIFITSALIFRDKSINLIHNL